MTILTIPLWGDLRTQIRPFNLGIYFQNRADRTLCAGWQNSHCYHHKVQLLRKIPQMYQCNSTDNRTDLWWRPDTVINRFHKENVCLCLKQLSLKTLVSLRAQQALPWNLWDVKLLKASERTGVATVWDFTRVTDDPMTAGYIILSITHMTSFKGTWKKVTLERAHQPYCIVAQWKRPLLKYCTTLGPLLQLPNQTQLTSKCCTKMLLEVSH